MGGRGGGEGEEEEGIRRCCLIEARIVGEKKDHLIPSVDFYDHARSI